jgi:hypothetical protein
MKKVIILAGIVTLALSSCTTSKLTTYSDDVYANPKQERLEKERLAAAKKKQEEELARKQAEERTAELAAQKAKDDANPYYKDPSYNKDDYYDYQYASRIKRFNNPMNGVGYYDNYYTNSYMYNGNPSMYGTSIYSSYNYWGNSGYGYNSGYGCNSGWPSSYFGVSYGWGSPGYGGYGYNPYGGYGYNPYGYGSSSYWMGYNQGYNNGFYNGYYGYGNPYYGGYGYPYGGYGYGNGWGFFNQYDVNSGYGHATNAPRGSHDGGNGGRVSGPGLYSNGAARYIQEVQVAQATTPRFDNELRTIHSTGKSGGNYSNVNSGSYNNNNSIGRPNFNNTNGNSLNTGNGSYESIDHTKSNPVKTYDPYTGGSPKSTGTYEQPNIYNQQPHINTNQPTKSATELSDKPVKSYDNSPKFDSSPSFNSSPSYSSPRNSGGGGGGGHRPR